MIQAKKRPSLSITERTLPEHDELKLLYGSNELLELEDYDDDIRKITENSCISSVNRADLKKVSLMGSGKFCNVYSVTGTLSRPNSQRSTNQYRGSTKQCSVLAFKTIDQRRMASTDDLVVAAKDLANEAKLLSELHHKNIVQLRGVSNNCFSQSYLPDGENGGGFFLVLDLLRETLCDRLKHWRQDHRKKKRVSLSSIFQGIAFKSRIEDSRRVAMYNRIGNIVFDIAEAMEYLHSRQIVLRDLKPNNVGFDFETGSQIRLFDFGMARKINDCSSSEVCGTPRYMAPEAMSGKGYSLKVDVYSFGVLLFEICSLRSPYFDNYWSKKKITHRRAYKQKNLESTLDDFYSQVVEKNLRPSDDLKSTVPCPKMRELINDCWSKDPDNRPTFSDILSRLRSSFGQREALLQSQ